MSPPTSAPVSPPVETVNSVHLLGRVSWGPESRVLPSGDEVVQLRVVVPRSPRRGRGASAGRSQVDAIEVACWSARTRAAALRLAVDDYVDLEGSLHRRFYAAGQGRASRYEVEARRLRRVRPTSGRRQEGAQR
ncbi:single-stranded DNA-binding protein [Ornithinimicrobium ciconiae]|uniref:Single-stranded DNA-binding protein n=1 Tax=Ornithinimicrobium ciconiae TaxID=2594265 RepID=A0A516GB45_9MICO|nr:single-stranded DNA-binding protein [Ornithinimicrobium ciconiae]QDO88718.1 single-stranded DNA-binding protein [Ornithinimicrobium ciconiae]